MPGVTIAIAVALAYVFGFALTSLPLFRAGLAFAAIVPIALAADTVSITIMEAIDNLVVLLVPGALAAGLGDPLFWWPIALGFAIAWPFAFLAQRALGLAQSYIQTGVGTRMVYCLGPAKAVGKRPAHQ